MQATWTWSFDSLGRVRDEHDPDKGHWQYGYDDADRPLTQTDANRQVTTLNYDDVGRISTRQNAAGTTTYTYAESRGGFFNVGRLTTVTFTTPNRPVDTLRFDYDELGRVKRQWPTFDGTTYTVTKTWAPGGYHLSTVYPDGDTIGSIGYDEAGRVTSVPGILSEVSYDAAGRPLEKVNVNGTTTTWSYSDTRGALERIVTTPNVQDLGYTIDDAGLVREVTSNLVGEGWQYEYDDLDHLVQATNPTSPAASQTFLYDAGGRTSTTPEWAPYTYPALGQPRPHAPAAGREHLHLRPQRQPDLRRRPRSLWNANNLIDQIVVDQIGTTAFSYDALGERLKKTNGSTTSLYPFGDDYEITNGVTTKYISVEGLGVVAKQVTGGQSPGTYWLHNDHLGSIDAVTNQGGDRLPEDLPPLRRDPSPERQPHRIARLDRPEERHRDGTDVPPCPILRSTARNLPQRGPDRRRGRDEPLRVRFRGSSQLLRSVGPVLGLPLQGVYPGHLRRPRAAQSLQLG